MNGSSDTMIAFLALLAAHGLVEWLSHNRLSALVMFGLAGSLLVLCGPFVSMWLATLFAAERVARGGVLASTGKTRAARGRSGDVLDFRRPGLLRHFRIQWPPVSIHARRNKFFPVQAALCQILDCNVDACPDCRICSRGLSAHP